MILLVPLRWAIITALYAADSAGITFGLGQWLAPWLSSTVLQLGIAMPASRKQESEADYIGLMMMAKSCYDPSAAVGVWERMEAAEKYGIPEWMSTHPSVSVLLSIIQRLSTIANLFMSWPFASIPSIVLHSQLCEQHSPDVTWDGRLRSPTSQPCHEMMPY
jgi:Zn-dependent protease with chaperone function